MSRVALASINRLALTSVILLALARPAAADLAPPPDHPDHFCTPMQQCPEGFLTCSYSRQIGSLGKPPDPAEQARREACQKEAERKGLAYRCRNGNNYSGTALYCPPGATGSWPGSQRFAKGAASAASTAATATTTTTATATAGATAPTRTTATATPAESSDETTAPESPGCGCRAVGATRRDVGPGALALPLAILVLGRAGSGRRRAAKARRG
jgi:hypothetical protein